MTITTIVREQVRQRAGFACEFCGAGETDIGAMLTVDHFQPMTKNGSDDLENLIYCCAKCNQYKSDYWPDISSDPQLWNPRHDNFATHFLLLDDGKIHPLTSLGTFTLARLRLNRPQLIAHRLQKQQRLDEQRLLTRYRDLMQLIGQLLAQQATLLAEQQEWIREQQELLRIFTDRQ